MEVHISEILGITEISSKEFNTKNINRIGEEYGALRQISKAPT